jgi:hypothetical protein
MSLAAVLDACADDVLLAIVIALPTPADLLRLTVICRASAQRFYFTATCFGSAAVATGCSGRAANGEYGEYGSEAVETWSIVQEAARLWLIKCSDQERGWVPRCGLESRLGRMREVELLRRPLVFGRWHAMMALSEGGSRVTIRGDNHERCCVVASRAVMRAGRHYAQFTVLENWQESGAWMSFGVIRPGWDVEDGEDAFLVNGHCFYNTWQGSCFPGEYSWEGQDEADQKGDRVGLLLDLDQGSMTVYKNDERLGVMVSSGLSGEYCWGVELYNPGDSACIAAAAAPASPTAEELERTWTRGLDSASDSGDD